MKLIQTVISTTSSVSSKEDGLIFFVENEFTTNSKKNKSLSMINVIKLKKDGTTENYKVKYRYSKQTLTFEENIEYYHKTMVKVKKLFLQENQRIFIGCIRDDHDNHGSERRKTK